MKTQLRFTGVAVTALMLATAPAGAASLNIGGDDGLLDLDGSDGGDAVVSVDLGAGGDGGSDAGTGVDIDLNLLDGAADDGVLDLFGDDKQLLETGGDSLVTVDTDDDADAVVTLFGTSDGGPLETVDDGLLDEQVVDVELLDDGGGDDALLRLFGPGSDAIATVDAGGDEGLLDVTGSDGAVPLAGEPVTLQLFGAGGGSAGEGGGGTAIDETTTASTGDGDGGDGAGIAPMPRPVARVAATGAVEAGEDCFAPDRTQIAHLLGRATYDQGDAAGWQDANSISIVAVDLCPDAGARLDAALEADPNIGFMQTAVEANARLTAELVPAYEPDDVLAVDQSGDELTIYVY